MHSLGTNRKRRTVAAAAVLLATITLSACFPTVGLIRQGGSGYWLASSAGQVTPIGKGTPAPGSLGKIRGGRTIVGGAHTPSGNGYWLVASDGAVFNLGDAKFFGAQGGAPLKAPIVGMAATPSGNGYWLVGGDGAIFAFGGAAKAGGEAGKALPKPIVGMASTPSGAGYWLVGADGSVYPHGDAQALGSLAGTPTAQPIVGMASTAGAQGYWLVARNGGVWGYGAARALGSLPIQGVAASNVVSITGTPDNGGYWITRGDGNVHAFGNAPALGGAPVAGPAPAPAAAPAPAPAAAPPASGGARDTSGCPSGQYRDLCVRSVQQARSNTAAKAIQFAMRQAGRPYCQAGDPRTYKAPCNGDGDRFGRGPAQGFDCSGLVYRAYLEAGKDIKANSTGYMINLEATGWAKAVPGPLPGDLLVNHNAQSQHVSLALADGMSISAVAFFQGVKVSAAKPVQKIIAITAP